MEKRIENDMETRILHFRLRVSKGLEKQAERIQSRVGNHDSLVGI